MFKFLCIQLLGEVICDVIVIFKINEVLIEVECYCENGCWIYWEFCKEVEGFVVWIQVYGVEFGDCVVIVM